MFKSLFLISLRNSICYEVLKGVAGFLFWESVCGMVLILLGYSEIGAQSMVFDLH